MTWNTDRTSNLGKIFSLQIGSPPTGENIFGLGWNICQVSRLQRMSPNVKGRKGRVFPIHFDSDLGVNETTTPKMLRRLFFGGCLPYPTMLVLVSLLCAIPRTIGANGFVGPSKNIEVIGVPQFRPH